MKKSSRVKILMALLWGWPKRFSNISFSHVVDLGAGTNPRNPMRSNLVTGVDLAPESMFSETPEVKYLQIGDGGKLPFEDQSLDGITAFDVIEHLPRQSSQGDDNLFIKTMNEIYRTLKPGGFFLAITPCYPSPSAFLDPTHVNIITPTTHKYFSDDVYARGLNYGFDGEFRTLAVGWYPWVGSWIDSARLVNGLQVSKQITHQIGLFRRVISVLSFYLLFPWRKSHYLWLLQRV
jgi:SAM-dependent methyltransferase